MNWLTQRQTNGKVDPYWIASDCGQYTVSKVVVRDRPQYVAWHAPGGRRGQEIGSSPDAEACKAMCERHAAGRGKR